VALHPGLSTLQSALHNVPSSLNGDYVICLHGGAYGNADSVHKPEIPAIAPPNA
jgi:hypothetical protein